MCSSTSSVYSRGSPTPGNAGPKLAHYHDGNLDPHLYGAWSQYNVGQYTGFSGIEPVREGNIHFAGEHTSLESQGFIEGAVETGERVAAEILTERGPTSTRAPRSPAMRARWRA